MSELEKNASRADHPASRRSIIRWLAAAATVPVAGWKLNREALADDAPKASASEKRRKEIAQYRLYLVVPKNFFKFTEERRIELEVLGPGSEIANGAEVSMGYLAWSTAEEAAKLREAPDVRSVELAKPSKKVDTKRAKPGENLTLLIRMAPAGWRMRPHAATYFTSSEIAAQWTKEFKDLPGVQVSNEVIGFVQTVCNAGHCRANLKNAFDVPITIKLPQGKNLEKVIQKIESNRQISELRMYTDTEVNTLIQLQTPHPGIDGCPGCGLG